jgi:hypothetical protein
MDRALFDRIPGAPWRAWEIVGILLAVMVAWPLAAAYVGWRLWRSTRRESGAASAPGTASPFEAYKRATLERLEAEEREYAETLRELRRARDPQEFERFAGGRRASA